MMTRTGTMIKKYRTERGWSQAELAKRSGLSAVYVGQIERGMRSGPTRTLTQIADALQIPIALLVDQPETPLRPVHTWYCPRCGTARDWSWEDSHDTTWRCAGCASELELHCTVTVRP